MDKKPIPLTDGIGGPVIGHLKNVRQNPLHPEETVADLVLDTEVGKFYKFGFPPQVPKDFKPLDGTLFGLPVVSRLLGEPIDIGRKCKD